MDLTVISNLTSSRPYFGDHLMVELTVNGPKRDKEITMRRDWRRYSGGLLTDMLNQINWQVEFDDVQSCWNHFENNIIRIVDEIASNKKFCLNTAINKPNMIANRFKVPNK